MLSLEFITYWVVGAILASRWSEMRFLAIQCIRYLSALVPSLLLLRNMRQSDFWLPWTPILCLSDLKINQIFVDEWKIDATRVCLDYTSAC